MDEAESREVGEMAGRIGASCRQTAKFIGELIKSYPDSNIPEHILIADSAMGMMLGCIGTLLFLGLPKELIKKFVDQSIEMTGPRVKEFENIAKFLDEMYKKP